jgi:hypothetical protein
MGRKFAALGLCLTAGLFTVSGLVTADDKKKDTPTIEDCMKFQGKKGLANQVKDEAAAGKWEAAQADATALKALGDALGKNSPPMGSKDSWEKLAKKFADQTSAVDAAAQKKDSAAVGKAVTALLDNKNCGACHMAHKPKK